MGVPSAPDRRHRCHRRRTGTIGAIGMSPEGLRAECKKLRGMLEPGDAIGGTLPYGVDLLLPQVGGNARKTNKD